jgi:hypothetical protein
VVDLDRTTERALAFTRGSPAVAIGMQRTAELPMPLFECVQVERERGLDAQSLERVGQADAFGAVAKRGSVPVNEP